MQQQLRSKLLGIVIIAGTFSAVNPCSAAESGVTNPAKTQRKAAARSGESVRSGTLVAPDGQTAVTSIDRKWDEKSGTGTLNEAAVTPDGRIYSREANLTRHADGTISTRGTFTDFDGQSYNYTETTRRTAAGVVEVGRMQDADGKMHTYETTTARTSGNQTKRTMVITHPDGTKETRVEILAANRTIAGL